MDKIRNEGFKGKMKVMRAPVEAGEGRSKWRNSDRY